MRTKPILCCPTPAGVLTRINWMGGGRERGKRRMGKGEVKEKCRRGTKERGEAEKRKKRRKKKTFPRGILQAV